MLNDLIIPYLIAMLDELKEVKYFKELTDFKNLRMQNTLKK